jgi:SSS family solute:Na+ symporter
MAIPAIVTLVFVTTSSVIFSGGKFVSEYYNDVPILNNLTAVCWMIAGALLTLIKPMKTPVVLPVNDQIELESSKGAKIVGVGVVIATIALYAVFW